jgi:DNA mismatch repair ATPase MutS
VAELSPMMQHYLKTKEEYPGCILFYRLGDFYEMFFEDAKIVSKELELTLTGRACGLEERAPMCGVPFHAADNYLNKLVQKGVVKMKHGPDLRSIATNFRKSMAFLRKTFVANFICE